MSNHDHDPVDDCVYEHGYADACEATNHIVESALQTSNALQALNSRYAEEIQRLRGLLGLPPFPLLEGE